MAAALATCIAAWFGCAALFLPFSLLPSPWAPWIPSVLVIYICMAPRSLAEHARKVENALRSGNAGEARHSVSMIVDGIRNGWTSTASPERPLKAWRRT